MNYSATKAGHQFSQYVLFSYSTSVLGESHVPPNPNDIAQMNDLMMADVHSAIRDQYEINIGRLNDSRNVAMVPLPSQAIKFASTDIRGNVPVILNRQVGPTRIQTRISGGLA